MFYTFNKLHLLKKMNFAQDGDKNQFIMKGEIEINKTNFNDWNHLTLINYGTET